jgi:N-acetylglucosamine kinase-like BadF-type ATPase
MRVLGIDAGATKTECLLADENGAILAKARGPGANFQLFAEDEVEFVIESLSRQLLSGQNGAADALCIGMAGAGREQDFQIMQGILDRLGLARVNVVTNDALIALVAGAGERYGVVLIVGTGAAAFGVDRGGREARAGGWGPLLGDEGSAYWMGLRALRAVVRAHDGRSAKTLLEGPILRNLGVDRVDALVHRIYRELSREEIAALAPVVQQAADVGDGEAQGIIDEAVREFVRAVESVIGRLDLAGEEFRLVLSGGLFKAVPVLRQDFESIIRKVAPWAKVEELKVEPARGAVHLALERVRPSGSAEGPLPPVREKAALRRG